MSVNAWGGAVNSTAMNTSNPGVSIFSDPIAMPTIRLAADGQRPVRFNSVALSYLVNGVTSIIYQGVEPALPATFGGTGGTFQVRASRTAGTMSVGRNTGGGGSTYWSDGGSLPGIMPGSFDYSEVPSAPTLSSVTPTGSGQASVAWASPASDGGSAITGYRIEWATDAGFTTGTGSKTVGVVTSDTITGLTPGATYYFRVSAINAISAAALTWSVFSGTLSALLGSAPGAPTGLTLTPRTGTLSAAWVAPASTGGLPITSYVVEVATDALFAGIVATLGGRTDLTRTIVGLAPATTFYVRVRAVNSVGAGAWSSTVSTVTPARGTLDIVQGVALHLADGTQIELRSDGAASPTLTLGFIAFGTGSTFTSIAAIPVGSSASSFAAPGGPRNLALTADAGGNLYVTGRRGDSEATLYVRCFARLTSTTWAAPTSLSGALTSTGDPINAVAAAFVPGSGVSPVPSILVLARRAGMPGVGALSWASLNLASLAAGSGALFIGSGSDPTWLSTPPAGAAPDVAPLDVAPLTAGSTRLAILANGYAVVDVVNGSPSGVVKAAAATVTASRWARVLGVNATTLVVLTVSGGALAWSFLSTSGSVLGSGTLAGANAQGGAFGEQWDAYVDRVAGAVSAYFVGDPAGARTLDSVDVSTSAYTAGSITTLTSALGAASSTNAALRIPAGVVDERRMLVAAANLLTGTKSTAAYVDTTGNVAPSAPALVDVTGFDASQSFAFAWAFGDPNSADTQTAYELQIQRVSDSVGIVATGKVTSSAPTRTVAAATLTNGVGYRWRVRTYDVLDVVGAWSSYDTFTTAALGTLTITSPAVDNVPTFDVATRAVAWSYVQGDGYVQTQRRVRVIRVADSSVLSDTTMQASTATTYTASIPSDEPVRVEVSIVTNAPGTPTVTANRLVTSSYAKPMTPTITATASDVGVTIAVTNPVPTGAQPEAVQNIIERRAPGSDVWVPIARVGHNGSHDDYAVRSAGEYTYRAKAVSA